MMGKGLAATSSSEAAATGLGARLVRSSPLFGGPLEWKTNDWIASDDRVRGGSSQSYLTPFDPPVTARFHGSLDTTTLGGAGFASQRTSTEKKVWDLSSHSGVLICLQDWDEKSYIFALKDEIPSQYVESKNQKLREEASVSWEHEFTPSKHVPNQDAGSESTHKSMLMLWKDFKPTYRGRELKDAEPLHLTNIRRMSLMMRSFFGKQEGDFSLTLSSIEAVTLREDATERATGSQHKTEGQETVGSDTDSQGLDRPKVTIRDGQIGSNWHRQMGQAKSFLCGCWRR